MSRAREKALELAVSAIGFGMPVKDAHELLQVAEVFRAWIDLPEAPQEVEADYPRLQGVDWADPLNVPERR